MRTLAGLIMVSSLSVLVWVMHDAVVVGVLHTPGLANPTVHLTLDPEFRDVLFAMTLVAAISAYCFATITWTEQKLEEIRSLVHQTRTASEVRQPLEVRLLKDAIRAGDTAAVQRHAKPSAFSFIDNHYLTPLELADLYENQPVIDALRAAMQKHGRRGSTPGAPVMPLSSQFALRQPARRPDSSRHP